MKILVLGASGMLGNAMFRVLSENLEWDVLGTVRTDKLKEIFPIRLSDNLISGIDANDSEILTSGIETLSPDVVINCIGITKHLSNADDPLVAIPINSLLPHRLARVCRKISARVIHISTDCVFSGEKGNYTEQDKIDIVDLYGISKYLGELSDPNTITLRTSIIGHELNSCYGLLEWFLSQKKQCKGFTKAIFSGFPTVVLAQIVRDIVIPRTDLSGLYHIASEPISKYDLLQLIAKQYKKKIEIIPDAGLVIDRSLNGAQFTESSGYSASEWFELIRIMHTYHKNWDE